MMRFKDRTEARRYEVLRRLTRIAHPATFEDLGTLAGPETIKRFVARGFIKVEMAITAKGLQELAWITQEAARRKPRHAGGRVRKDDGAPSHALHVEAA